MYVLRSTWRDTNHLVQKQKDHKNTGLRIIYTCKLAVRRMYVPTGLLLASLIHTIQQLPTQYKQASCSLELDQLGVCHAPHSHNYFKIIHCCFLHVRCGQTTRAAAAYQYDVCIIWRVKYTMAVIIIWQIVRLA